MPQNDPVVDSLDYSESVNFGQVEFDEMRFEDIDEDDLFWFSNNPNSNLNNAFRKINETSGMNTRSGIITEDINIKTIIYQKP